MPIQIPADTTPRVETNPDGSLILHFDRKRTPDPETTSIETTEVADVDVTADVTAVADNDVTFTLKRHKTDVFDGKLALAKSLVATHGNDARTAAIERMFVGRCDEQPGDHLIEAHRKYFFTISHQRGSVLSIAQALDSPSPTIKLGKLAGLKMLNDRKVAVRAKKMREKQQTGRLAIYDGQQMFTALYDAARAVVLTEPTDETAVICEDLLRFNLQLRMNEGCPHAVRDDGHRLSVDDFVFVRGGICTFKAGSKSHSNFCRAEYGKICLFDHETTKGLLKHVFFDGRKGIGNDRKAELSRTQLEHHHGIMQYITDVSDKYSRGKWRGIGASFLIKLFDDETAVCSEMGSVSTAQASLDHVSSNTTAGYLAYKFEGDEPQKLAKSRWKTASARSRCIRALRTRTRPPRRTPPPIGHEQEGGREWNLAFDSTCQMWPCTCRHLDCRVAVHVAAQ